MNGLLYFNDAIIFFICSQLIPVLNEFHSSTGISKSFVYSNTKRSIDIDVIVYNGQIKLMIFHGEAD